MINRNYAVARIILLAFMFLVGCGNVFSQKIAWPTKPITLINPFPAGGSTDDISRFIANKLSTELGQTIVVLNVAGAAGSIGMQKLARSPNDGYTIGFAHIGTHVMAPLLYANVGYDPVKDFTPIAKISEYTNVLIVNKDTPYRKLEDLLDAARKNPGAINYGSAGNGSSNHLSAVLLGKMTNVSFTHIPYKGSAPALMDLIAGNIPFMFDVLVTSMPHLKAGKVRALATTGKVRDSSLPDVPTVAETVPGYSVIGWTGIMAPAGVPKEIVERLAVALANVTSTPEAEAYISQRGGNEFSFGSPSEFGQLVKNSLAFWGPVVKASGAKID